MKLRPLNEPKALRVRTDPQGTPATIMIGRRTRRVEGTRETWRIDDEWWRQRVSRLYYEVVLEDGGALTLYRDLVDGSWYAQR